MVTKFTKTAPGLSQSHQSLFISVDPMQVGHDIELMSQMSKHKKPILKSAERHCPVSLACNVAITEAVGHKQKWLVILDHTELCKASVFLSYTRTQRIYSNTVYRSADREVPVISCSIFKSLNSSLALPHQEFLTSSSQPGKPLHNRHNSLALIISHWSQVPH